MGPSASSGHMPLYLVKHQNWVRRDLLMPYLYIVCVLGNILFPMNPLVQLKEQTTSIQLADLSTSLTLNHPCRRYTLHRPEETEAHFPPLVPPHHCAALLLVLL